MAEETTQRQVILDFELKATQALKDAATLQLELEGLKRNQKSLGKVTAENAEQYQDLSAQIKYKTAQLRSAQTQIANTLKAQSAMSGEVEKQRAKLAALTAEWSRLKKEDADYVAKDAALQKAMAETTVALKAAEEAHGDNRRSVGDYEKASVSLRSELRSLTEQLVQMRAAGQTGSEEFQTLLQRAQELKDAQTDVNAVLSKGADNTEKNLNVIGEAVSGVIAAYGLYQSAAAAMGIDNKDLEKTIVKLQVAYTALQAAEKIRVTLQKGSATYIAAENLLRKIGINRVKAQASAEAALNVIRGKGNIITKAGAAATWLWNAALAANPVVLLVAGVVALTAGVWGLAKAFGGAADAMKTAEAAGRQYEKQTAITEKSIAEIGRKREQASHDAAMAGRKEIEELKKNGASKEQIARAEYEMNAKVRDAEYKALIRNRGEYWNQIQDAEATIAVLEKQQKKFDTDSKNWNKLKEQIDETKNSLAQYRDLYAATGREVQVNLQDQADAELEYGKQVADATYERLMKSLDQQKTFNESRIKAEAGYQSEDFASRQQYARRLRDLADQNERERLTLSRKYGKITQAEYTAQLSVLSNAMQEFQNAQAKEANAYYIAQREAILSMFDQSAQEQIDKINEKYAKALEKLDKQEVHAPDASAYAGGTENEDYPKAQLEYEDFLFRRAEIAYRLEQAKQEEIAAIEENSLRTRAEKIEKEIARQYDGDLRQYQDNERKKTEITIQQLEAQKRAKEKEGLDTYDEDAALLESRRQLNQLNLDADLLAAGENAKARYEIRKAYLKKEMALAAGNADRQAELNAESLTNEQEHMQARIESVEKWSSASKELMSGVNDLFNALGEAKLQKAQEDYDKESEMLKEQLENGFISQEEYDRKQKKLDQDLEKEQKKIAREQAIREKMMSMFQIAIDTSLGIMKAVAESPLTGGMPWSAIVGAMGAVQLAAVAAQPLPKAARGRKIKGRSHAQGGELVVAEDGEIIMNKRSVSMFEPLLSQISVAGGGVPFTGHIPDGGYTARWATSATLSKADVKEAMTDAVKDLKVYTAITDIRRENGNFATVESRGTI